MNQNGRFTSNFTWGFPLGKKRTSMFQFCQHNTWVEGASLCRHFAIQSWISCEAVTSFCVHLVGIWQFCVVWAQVLKFCLISADLVWETKSGERAEEARRGISVSSISGEENFLLNVEEEIAEKHGWGRTKGEVKWSWCRCFTMNSHSYVC